MDILINTKLMVFIISGIITGLFLLYFIYAKYSIHHKAKKMSEELAKNSLEGFMNRTIVL